MHCKRWFPCPSNVHQHSFTPTVLNSFWTPWYPMPSFHCNAMATIASGQKHQPRDWCFLLQDDWNRCNWSGTAGFFGCAYCNGWCARQLTVLSVVLVAVVGMDQLRLDLDSVVKALQVHQSKTNWRRSLLNFLNCRIKATRASSEIFPHLYNIFKFLILLPQNDWHLLNSTFQYHGCAEVVVIPT